IGRATNDGVEKSPVLSLVLRDKNVLVIWYRRAIPQAAPTSTSDTTTILTVRSHRTVIRATISDTEPKNAARRYFQTPTICPLIISLASHCWYANSHQSYGGV